MTYIPSNIRQESGFAVQPTPGFPRWEVVEVTRFDIGDHKILPPMHTLLHRGKCFTQYGANHRARRLEREVAAAH